MLAKVTNGAFAGLTNLTHLDLSYNKLGKLEATSVRSIFNLQVLNISGNMQIDLFDIRDTFLVSLTPPSPVVSGVYIIRINYTRSA